MVNERLIDWTTEYFKDSELELIRSAYKQAALAHNEQRRVSGEPYIVHCVEVARLLAELGLDSHAVTAGLLHDVVEDTDWTVERIHERFGAEVAQLVDGVTKLGQIDTLSKMSSREIEAQEAESLRKMFLAMVDDVRVVLIKLADRLHNMRTLELAAARAGASGSPGDAGDLRPAGQPPGHLADQVGAGGPGLSLPGPGAYQHIAELG